MPRYASALGTGDLRESVESGAWIASRWAWRTVAQLCCCRTRARDLVSGLARWPRAHRCPPSTQVDSPDAGDTSLRNPPSRSGGGASRSRIANPQPWAVALARRTCSSRNVGQLNRLRQGMLCPRCAALAASPLSRAPLALEWNSPVTRSSTTGARCSVYCWLRYPHSVGRP